MKSALAIKERILPNSSRQIAELHYRLSIALDLTPGKLGEAINHVEKALENINERLTGIKERLSKGVEPVASNDDPKGKGKAKATGLYDSIQTLSESQLQHELKDLEELKQDLVLKV